MGATLDENDAAMPPASRADALRQALRSGALSARALGQATGIPVKQIRCLLKHDLLTGRVKFARGNGSAVGLYELQSGVDLTRRQEVGKAKRLLRSQGYVIYRKGHA